MVHDHIVERGAAFREEVPLSSAATSALANPEEEDSERFHVELERQVSEAPSSRSLF